MIVLDENMTFIYELSNNFIFWNFYFVLGIILDHFRHPKSIVRYRKRKILWIFAKKMTSKSIFINKIGFSIKKNKKKLKIRKKTGKTWKIKTDVTEPWVTSNTTVSSLGSEACFSGVSRDGTKRRHTSRVSCDWGGRIGQG